MVLDNKLFPISCFICGGNIKSGCICFATAREVFPNEPNLVVDKQLEFVDWLKERGLYNPMENAVTMQKMHEVWEAATE